MLQNEENPQIQNFESAGFLVRDVGWNGFTRDHYQCEGIWKDFFPIKSWQGDGKYDIIVFCKCKFLKFADKNGEFCISVLEKVAGCPAGLPDAS